MENDITIFTFLIVCLLVGLAGFVDSIAGGGGLISLPAYLIAGLSPINASATNKVSAFMGASVSFFNYLKKGYVNIILAIPCCIVAILLSGLGAKIQTMIPELYLKIIMLIALPATLIFILNKKSFENFENNVFDVGKREVVLSLLISALMGLYDGVYGPGCGTFLLLFFVNVVKFNIKNSNGLAKAINWATNVGSILYFLSAGKAFIGLGIVAGCFDMLGSYIGSKIFIKKGVNIVRPIMIIVIIIFIFKIVFELIV